MDNSWKAYFIFSKKEQRGVMVLGCLLLGSLAIGYFFPAKERVDKNTIPINAKLFYFDPNTIDSMGALRLGIPQKQVTTLLRYRNKGGRFYNKEDIAKLYGLKKELVEKLIPYVVIQNKERNRGYRNKLSSTYNKFSSTYKNLDDWSIDINTSDEKQWAAKTKLNTAVIKNIIQYRNYLGGFTNLNQIKKVYGFNEADYYLLKPHLKLGKIILHKPNASKMSFEQWKQVGLFGDREIVKILRIRKENGGHIGWKELVILFDLTAAQAEMLQNTIQISE
jgi:DNA uptake protein ComE-like DNA-binding protein